MVPARCQIDVLDISGYLTIQNSADKEPDGSLKIVLCVDRDVVALVVAGGREVVFDHFARQFCSCLREHSQIQRKSRPKSSLAL
jgi:hypothetical protein